MPRISLPMPTPLARAARRFQEWREQRTTHRIPEELWTLATDLGQRYGVCRTARALGVQYPDLKTRIGLAKATTLPEPSSSSPAFVEYLAPAPPPTCVIELEGARGARMRVQLQGVDESNLVAFARVFLEAQA